ncbi:energy-coupling factor ABC transporter ATP-binding protein [Paucidesulfovibrio longus]|uniref:energy-coupling factor ABC transporter ATP-binding protein n=1 Tax=Paucidesulfovibrio longus TaxID=889 RepID=UPI0003B5D04F|nr:ABC transporter ATP-binding protein [Paucidesulfovibrio longus]
MIQIHELGYAYAGGQDALRGVSLSLERGGLHVLAGANGSGKSTLLALMAGLYLPSTGTLVVGGRSGEDIRDLARLVMQDADLQILGGSVGEDLLLGRENRAGMEQEAGALLDRFHMQGLWDRAVHTLSGGMKRKLCLAAALLDNPELLLLDEPMSGLDYPAMLELRSILAANAVQGVTQVVSVHDLEPVIDLADTLTVLSGGVVALHGKPESVLDAVREHHVRPPATWQAGLGIRSWDVGND